jgi:hypothetical protein
VWVGCFSGRAQIREVGGTRSSSYWRERGSRWHRIHTACPPAHTQTAISADHEGVCIMYVEGIILALMLYSKTLSSGSRRGYKLDSVSNLQSVGVCGGGGIMLQALGDHQGPKPKGIG